MPSSARWTADSKTIARSSSPLRRSGTQSSGSDMLIDSSTAGCCSRKAAIASGISVAPADSKAAMRRRPPRRPAIASSSASASARRAMIVSVWRTIASPASVSLTPRARRCTSVVPASRSSAAICWETADCVNDSASAAAENDPWTATSRRTLMRRTSSISRTYISPSERSFDLMPACRKNVPHVPLPRIV